MPNRLLGLTPISGQLMSSLSPQQQAIADLFDSHMAAEMKGDLDNTMVTMAPDPHLINVGSGTGGVGHDAVRAFYANDLMGQFFPPDAEIIPISRTINAERLVDEMVVRFTHDRVITWLLPGLAPTGRRVEVAFVVIVGVRDGKVAYEHIYCDQAAMVAQLGLIDPTGLPIDVNGAARLLAVMGKG